MPVVLNGPRLRAGAIARADNRSKSANSNANQIFPLSVSGSGRYLLTASGLPFLLCVDAAWSLAVSASPADITTYLDERKAKGFNAVIVNAIEHLYDGGNGQSPPNNWNNVAPFTKTSDWTTTVEAYWTSVDYILDQAAQRDMLVMVFPAYSGFQGGSSGWWAEMQANGVAKLASYGTWLGNRWASRKNIFWCAGGDYDVPDKTLVKAYVNGIKSTGHPGLWCWHGARGTATPTFWSGDYGWIDVNTVYDDVATPASNMQAAVAASPIKPAFRIEARYEGNPVGVSLQGVRGQIMSSMLSGCGGSYGHEEVWPFEGPGGVNLGMTFQQGMAAPGSTHMSKVQGMLSTRRWHLLQPDALFMTGGFSGAFNYGAKASDGSWGIGYTTGAALTFDISQLNGNSALCRWFDPTNGAYTVVGTFSGSQVFTPPATNSAGDSDWLCLLET